MFWTVIQAGTWVATQDAEWVRIVGAAEPMHTLESAHLLLTVAAANRSIERGFELRWDLRTAVKTLVSDVIRGGPFMYGRLFGEGSDIEKIDPLYRAGRRVRDDARGIIFVREDFAGAKWWDRLTFITEAVQAFYPALPISLPEFDGPLVLQAEKIEPSLPVAQVERPDELPAAAVETMAVGATTATTKPSPPCEAANQCGARRGPPSPVALKGAFSKWMVEELARREIVTERAAKTAMREAFPRHHVSRKAIRNLIDQLVPEEKRAPKHRPQGG
jgi:hypothetical protein